jgi:CheY-like chemotaxis protein
MSHPGRATPHAIDAGVDVASRDVSERTILVVDHEAAVRRLIGQALGSRGHRVIEAVGGREALRAIYEESRTPDLVVADGDMASMPAVEFAARLVADRPGIRIVLLTGRAGSAAAARERSNVVAAVLLKPFSLDELLAAVDSTLGTPPA